MNMKAKGKVYLVGLLFGIVFLIAPQGWTQPKPETGGPAITHAFAIDKGVLWINLENLY